MRVEQAIFNLEIKKKSGLSINPDIHHSKVFSSDFIILDLIHNNTFLYNIKATGHKIQKCFDFY